MIWKCFTDPYLTAVVGKLNAVCTRFYSISHMPLWQPCAAPGRRKKENDASSVSDRLQCCWQRKNKLSATCSVGTVCFFEGHRPPCQDLSLYIESIVFFCLQLLSDIPIFASVLGDLDAAVGIGTSLSNLVRYLHSLPSIFSKFTLWHSTLHSASTVRFHAECCAFHPVIIDGIWYNDIIMLFGQ